MKRGHDLGPMGSGSSCDHAVGRRELELQVRLRIVPFLTKHSFTFRPGRTFLWCLSTPTSSTLPLLKTSGTATQPSLRLTYAAQLKRLTSTNSSCLSLMATTRLWEKTRPWYQVARLSDSRLRVLSRGRHRLDSWRVYLRFGSGESGSCPWCLSRVKGGEDNGDGHA